MENAKDALGDSTTGKSGTLTTLKVAAFTPTVRISETWTASVPVFLTAIGSLVLVTPRRPEKCSSSGVTSSGSRNFSTLGAGSAASTFGAGLGGGFVAQPPRRRPAHKIPQHECLVRMVDLD